MQFVGTGPLTPAVTVAEFKRAVHIEQDIYDDDPLIAGLIAAAEDVVATAANCPLSVGVYRFDLPAGAWSRWWFPCAPVVAFLSIEVRDSLGVWSELQNSGFSLLSGYDEPQLVAPADWSGFDGLVSGVRVSARCGAVSTDLSTRSLRQAVILLAKEWFEEGLNVEGTAQTRRLSFGVRALINQKRYRRPQEVC